MTLGFVILSIIIRSIKTRHNDTQHYDIPQMTLIIYNSQQNDTRCNYIQHKLYETQQNDYVIRY